MMNHPKLLLLAGVLFMATLSTARAADGPAQPSDAGNRFATDLLRQLSAKSTDHNLFFSPWSISSALAMADAGARGNTAAQMNQVLHFPDAAAAQAAIAAISRELAPPADDARRTRPFDLSIANALWVDNAFPLDPAYLQATQKSFGAAAFPTNFSGDPEGSRTRINQWVEQQTRDKIKDLLAPRTISPSTTLVLTNAIYFKGTWQWPFSKSETADQEFHTASGATVQVPMMQSHKIGYSYLETDTFQAIALPYKTAEVQGAPPGTPGKSDLSMIILLPRKPDGLADLEKSITADNLAQWLPKMAYRPVDLFLPRFTMTSSFELSAPLKALGMTDAFSDHADFSGISPSAANKLAISAVIHKAFVDVNEEGTEAAAATGVVMVGSARIAAKPTFRADHPFLLLIRHDPSNTLLFIGHVANPKE